MNKERTTRTTRLASDRECSKMVIRIFGKEDCNHCQAVKKKLGFLLRKWKLAEQVPVQFVDLDTVEGLAEGAFHDVARIPTTMLHEKPMEGAPLGAVLARWDGASPRSSELVRYLKDISGVSAD